MSQQPDADTPNPDFPPPFFGSGTVEAEGPAPDVAPTAPEAWRIGRTLAERLCAAEAVIEAAQACVNEQAEDEGLWFVAETAPEAYLQQELRRLHSVIEANRG